MMIDDDDELFLWRLALFPAGTIVRDPHHRESPTRREQGLNLRRTEFRFSWMKLCSSDNHYTTAPLKRWLSGYTKVFCPLLVNITHGSQF